MNINLLGHLFGMPWISLGRKDLLSFPLESLRAPLVPLEGLGTPRGCFQKFLATGNLMCHEVTGIATRSAILELVTAATAATEMESKSTAQSLRSHAPGARMMVATQSPLNYIRYYIYIYIILGALRPPDPPIKSLRSISPWPNKLN